MTDRVLVMGIPSQDMIHAEFAFSLVYVALYAGCRFYLVNSRCSILAVQRNEIVSEAQRVGGTHLLFLDSDMKLPLDTAARLLGHDKDIVGATYVTRVPPHKILGSTFDDQPVKFGEGLRRMSVLPTGCLLISMKVFEKLDMPYFRFGVRNGTILGEDVDFCERAGRAGFEIWCDLRLSKEVGHIGQMVYSVP